MRTLPRHFDLTPDPPPPPARRRRRPPAPPAEDEGSAVKRRLDRLLAEDKAVRNVATGRVHPRLYDIARDAEYFFRPSWSLSENDRRGIGTVGSTSAAFARMLIRDYRERLSRHLAHAVPRGSPEREPTMMEVHNAMRRSAEADPANQLACTICVTVAPDRPVELALTRSSHREPFDRRARQALGRAVRRRLPRRSDRDRRPVRACYRIIASFSRVPPLPMVGCQFDEVALTARCFYPFKKVLRTTIRLETAHYLDEGPASARGSRRAPDPAGTHGPDRGR